MGASSEAKRNETKLIIEINRSPGGGPLLRASGLLQKLTHVWCFYLLGMGGGGLAPARFAIIGISDRRPRQLLPN